MSGRVPAVSEKYRIFLFQLLDSRTFSPLRFRYNPVDEKFLRFTAGGEYLHLPMLTPLDVPSLRYSWMRSALKVILFGASGMVGQGVLRECLLDPGVEIVTAIARGPVGQRHEKLREIILPDIGDLSSVGRISCAVNDACFFCVGIASAGMKEADYRRITFDLTLHAARTLARLNPQMTFIYVSGMGADSTAKGGVMWARVRGETENALLKLPFKGVYVFSAWSDSAAAWN